MRNYIVQLLLLFVVVLSSCRKKQNVPVFTFGEVGNIWTYERITAENYGMDTTLIDTVSMEITNDLGNYIYTMEGVWNAEMYIGDIFGVKNWYTGTNNDSIFYDTLLYAGSMAGDLYITASYPYSYGKSSYSVDAVNVPVLIENETYLCSIVRLQISDGGGYYYINNKYGIMNYSTTSCPGGGSCIVKYYRLISKNF